jgi:hypothetical protein
MATLQTMVRRTTRKIINGADYASDSNPAYCVVAQSGPWHWKQGATAPRLYVYEMPSGRLLPDADVQALITD